MRVRDMIELLLSLTLAENRIETNREIMGETIIENLIEEMVIIIKERARGTALIIRMIREGLATTKEEEGLTIGRATINWKGCSSTTNQKSTVLLESASRMDMARGVMTGPLKELTKQIVTNISSKNLDEPPLPLEENERKIFVNGFNPLTSEEELLRHFDQYGKVKEVNVRQSISLKSSW